jgi:hypothetical protein
MDEELLAEALRAEERLIDAERDAEVYRAEFHHAVRRLHLHGASLRELAGALGLSHQRVHQIVESAGGSRRWLRQREPGQREPGMLLACTFCGQYQAQVRKLIAGPRVYVCNDCVSLARTVINSRPLPGARFIPLFAIPKPGQPECEPRLRMACSFCGKQVHQVAALAASSVPPPASSVPPPASSVPPLAGAVLTERPAICTECLDLCAEIIAEDARENSSPT